MRIKITTENTDKIEAALAAVNGKAQSYTVTKFSDVAYVARLAEAKLVLLPKGERKGVTLRYMPEGPAASSYRYGAVSTALKLERGPRDWFLVDCRREAVWPKAKEVVKLQISSTQAESIAHRAVFGFTIAA